MSKGPESALGWAGSHTLVVDRPAGKAGGQGLGFNGGQLLALTLGGCFCNDLRYISHEMGVALDKISVTVAIELEGDPLITTRAKMLVTCTTSDGSDPQAVVVKAKEICMAANSFRRGIAVDIERA